MHSNISQYVYKVVATQFTAKGHSVRHPIRLLHQRTCKRVTYSRVKHTWFVVLVRPLHRTFLVIRCAVDVISEEMFDIEISSVQQSDWIVRV